MRLNKMRLVILYRDSQSYKEDYAEKEAATKAGFTVISKRAQIQPGDLVIPRFSALPYYSELEADCLHIGAKLLNSHNQYLFVSDLKNYVHALGELTPLTWDSLESLPEIGPFFLKGSINSKKSNFSKFCFAKDRKEAGEVYARLCEDGLISQQEIYIRQYVPLFTYAIGLGGLPITKEFRFFVVNHKIICGAYYWSSHLDQIDIVPSIDEVPQSFLDEVLARIQKADYAPNGYCLDVAITAEGKPIVIELNALEQAGLSENDPVNFYSQLQCELNTSM